MEIGSIQLCHFNLLLTPYCNKWWKFKISCYYLDRLRNDVSKHEKSCHVELTDKHLRIHHHLRVLVSRGLYKAFFTSLLTYWRQRQIICCYKSMQRTRVWCVYMYVAYSYTLCIHCIHNVDTMTLMQKKNLLFFGS